MPMLPSGFALGDVGKEWSQNPLEECKQTQELAATVPAANLICPSNNTDIAGTVETDYCPFTAFF